MNSSSESFGEQITRLKSLLMIYSAIQYNESKLFNLLAAEIEHIKENNQNSEKQKHSINRLMKRFNYPRELLIEPLSKELKVEKSTCTT